MVGNGIQELVMIVGTLIVAIFAIPAVLLLGSKDVGPEPDEEDAS